MEQLPTRRASPPDAQQPVLEPRLVRQIPSGPQHGGYVEIEPADAGGDELSQLLQYLNVLTRHKVALLLTALCGALLAFGVSLYQTPTFVASTTLEFQGFERQPFEGISYLNERDPFLLQTHVQLLGSRMLRNRVYERLMDKEYAGGESPGGPVESLRQWLGFASPEGSLGWQEAIALAGGGLTVTPVRDTRIVRIASASTVPQAAADYVNTLAAVFIEHSLEERWALYQNTGVLLERAQNELKAKLEESEEQLLAYSSASGLIVTSNASNIVEQKLLELQGELSRAQADRIAKEAVYETAVSRPAGSFAEVIDGGPMAVYETRIADLRRELADATIALTEAHPTVRSLQAQIEELRSAQSREHTNVLNRMRTEYSAALRRERQLAAGLDRQSEALAEQDQKLIRYKMLQREVETYRELYDTTLKTGKEASIASALNPVSARVIDPARPPRVPSSPNVTRNLIVGIVGGLVLGIGIVLIRERADASIRVPGSMPLHMNLRELGVIPSARADLEAVAAYARPRRLLPSAARTRTRSVPRVIPEPVELATWNRKGSLVAESFRATLTSILMSGEHMQDKKIILVTSPSPREGKSTVVTNLAIALAEIHQRVLLIDADLRRPRVHTILGQANTWGLTELLQEKTPCAEYPTEALARPSQIPGLFSLPSGTGTAAVSPLLYSARMGELLERLRHDFDAVLIDTPPVLAVADARILSRLVDAVVLVVRAGHTTREAATMAANLFEADGVPVLGTVLNDWDSRTMGNGYYPSEYSQYYKEASNS